MEIRFDHLVIAARTLEEGVQWVEGHLNVPMGPGGKHDIMGTYNRLLSLGPGRFLEVMAIDPDAPAPMQPRWFDLDSPAMHARLARGPALITWAARTDDIEAAIEAVGIGHPIPTPIARGTFRWKIGVPADGRLEHDGIVPTILQWFSQHPSEALHDEGCRLESLVLHHPEAPAILHTLHYAGLAADDPVKAHHEGRGLEALIRTPRGTVSIRE